VEFPQSFSKLGVRENQRPTLSDGILVAPSTKREK
jgi:hypothetical protein